MNTAATNIIRVPPELRQPAEEALESYDKLGN